MELLTELKEYGAIGLVSVISLMWAWRLYQDRNALITAHQENQNSQAELHQKEMQALRERYITKAETWMQKYHELASAQNEVLDAIERRYGR